jgi:hypothetical protein
MTAKQSRPAILGVIPAEMNDQPIATDHEPGTWHPVVIALL